jgi:glutamyl-tRNA reductase
MRLLTLGISHTPAVIDIRERLTLKKQDTPDFLSQLHTDKQIFESMILSTCNRYELYTFAAIDPEALIHRVCDLNHIDAGEFRPYWYVHEGQEAARHACRVASGLDSMVIGEPQILGQIKEAYRIAEQCSAAGGRMHQLFEQVFTVAKKVRATTGIGQNPLSVSFAAVKKARELFGGLEHSSVLMIGSGEMGELAVRDLKKEGVIEIFLTNRTFSRAVELSEKLGGVPIMFHEVADYLSRVDIVIVSVASDGYVLAPEHLTRRMQSQKKLFIIDISVPRAVDPLVGRIDGVQLCNIDDLQAVVAENHTRRTIESEKAEKIIDASLQHIVQGFMAYDMFPVITAMRQQAEDARQEAMSELMQTGTACVPPEAVDSTTRKMVNRIMHQTTRLLREFAAQPSREDGAP